ncbi:MAG: GDP-mannose 4,6-dehydratase [Candidatus Curtissbacteria bacterium]|nr:GDP-mannose 4,6-dehydratase [Candidatus Curtissbacteria bacterium]
MSLKGRKILVTGGMGFIGVNLATELEQLGADVTIFDLEKGDDIEDCKKLESTIKKRFDAIYHLAGFSGPSESNKDVKKSFGINTFSTVDLCKLILKHSPKAKLVLSSSRLEYGKPKYLPVDEDHPTNPISAYGLSKLTATQMALVYNNRYGLDVTIFRTSNVYGPHKKKQFPGYNIINDFIDKAKRGETLTIYGDGNQGRDYIYVDDLVEAFTAAAKNPNISSGQIYNLGYGKGIKFKNMVSLISNKAGKGEIEFVPWPKSYKDVETGSYISDISKIKKQLGFSPKIGFEEGIVKTIQAQR